MKNKIANGYLILMLAVFPLFVHDYYYDLTITKYRFVSNVTIVCALAMLLLTGKKQEALDAKGKKKLLHPESPKSIFRGQFLRKEMVCYIAFLFFGILSTVFSEHKKEAFFGNAGRFNGLLIYLVYGVAFCMLLSVGKIKEEVFYVFEAAGWLICWLGIINHYMMDPFGFFDNVKEGDFFYSTLGNNNVYGEYLLLLLVISAVLFCFCNQRGLRIFHGVTYVLAVFAMYTDGSDGAYLGVAAFLVFFVFALREKKEKLRYLRLLAYAILFMQLFRWLIPLHQKTNSKTVLYVNTHPALLPGAMVIVACLYLFLTVLPEEKRKWLEETLHTKVIYALLLVLGPVAAGVFFVAVNRGSIAISEYNPLVTMLVYNDNWGTGRGQIWRVAWESFLQLPFGKKLIGVGPDTLRYLYEALGQRSGESIIDNAHNVYLQMLLTHGLLGLLSWLSFLLLSLHTCLKKARREKTYYAIAFAVLSYYVAAVVGINLINTSAIVMILLGMGLCDLSSADFSFLSQIGIK